MIALLLASGFSDDAVENLKRSFGSWESSPSFVSSGAGSIELGVETSVSRLPASAGIPKDGTGTLESCESSPLVESLMARCAALGVETSVNGPPPSVGIPTLGSRKVLQLPESLEMGCEALDEDASMHTMLPTVGFSRVEIEKVKRTLD